MKIIAFWDITPCSLVEEDRRFEGTYCRHHQGDESLTVLMLERLSTSTRLNGAFQTAVVFKTKVNLFILKIKFVTNLYLLFKTMLKVLSYYFHIQRVWA
jgi:hypothetical protein